jgi:hypothetical protein
MYIIMHIINVPKHKCIFNLCTNIVMELAVRKSNFIIITEIVNITFNMILLANKKGLYMVL